ncbi:MAG: D-alanyl-D-alanine carboxypeptidase [Alphaproteobacteria bacterium]|nr:D-alanyl-D-alanine carboxypeptidase [Alphaproteobacteria bacterium]
MQYGFWLTLLLCVSKVVSAESIDTVASHAFLMDADTGYVMLNKNAEIPMPPASMSKLMTAYMIFDALKKGEYTLDSEFVVSDNAWKKGGAKTGSSTMFLSPNQRVKVRDLLRGIIVQSGNDACIVAAENMAGTEEAFANLMTKKAKQLGLTNAMFKNATGLPDPEHLISAHDLARLANRIIHDFPEYYPIYSEKEFTYNKIKQGNRNPLLYSMPGVDGLKTGHTSQSGFGLTGSMKTYDGRRLIMVVNGLKSMDERAQESKKIMSWGISSFENLEVLKTEKTIVEVPVWLGETKTVPAVPEKKLIATAARGETPNIKSIVKYDAPIAAPISKGQKLGTITTYLEDGNKVETNLIAMDSVGKVGFLGKIKALLHL